MPPAAIIGGFDPPGGENPGAAASIWAAKARSWRVTGETAAERPPCFAAEVSAALSALSRRDEVQSLSPTELSRLQEENGA